MSEDKRILSGALKGKIYDMHTHSAASHDSECPLSEMARAAKAAGLCGFAVTDHADFEFIERIDVDDVIGKSMQAIEECGERGVEILRGVEMGEGFYYPEYTARLIDKYDFDVVIGSVHAARFKGFEMPYSKIDFGKMNDAERHGYLLTYFADYAHMLEVSDFDIAAHLTCPFRYVVGKYGFKADPREYSAEITAILKQIISRGVALEVNTSNLGSIYDEYMPEQWIIAEYKRLGGELITLGSDAHIARDCAGNFDGALKELKSLGFENVYYYKKRCAIPCTL